MLMPDGLAYVVLALVGLGILRRAWRTRAQDGGSEGRVRESRGVGRLLRLIGLVFLVAALATFTNSETLVLALAGAGLAMVAPLGFAVVFNVRGLADAFAHEFAADLGDSANGVVRAGGAVMGILGTVGVVSCIVGLAQA